MRRRLLRLVAGLALLLVAALAGILGFIYSGLYNVAATRQHSPIVYWGFMTGLRRSIEVHAARDSPQPPNLSDPAVVAGGLLLYERDCVSCHGAPGRAPDAVGLGLTPPPPNLAQRARERSPRELFWTISNGLKMTGMPAWEYRLSERQRWAVVAFLAAMPNLSPARYRALRTRLLAARAVRARDQAVSRLQAAVAGDAGRGRIAIRQYACQTCHVIPGVTGADALVGPPLNGIADRAYLAGVLLNTPDNMIVWLRHPQQVDPLSAMPDLGVSERDARDIAAYLHTLR